MMKDWIHFWKKRKNRVFFIFLFLGTSVLTSGSLTINTPIAAMSSVKSPKLVWKIPATIESIFGVDSHSKQNIALTMNHSHFSFFQQPLTTPVWEQQRRIEGYSRERPLKFVEISNTQMGLLTVFSIDLNNQYRLLNLTTGEPLTEFFKAGTYDIGWNPRYQTPYSSVLVFSETGSTAPQILAILNGTAQLMTLNLEVIWNFTFLPFPSWASRIYATDDVLNTQVFIRSSTGNASWISCLDSNSGSVIWQVEDVNPVYKLYKYQQTTIPMITDFNNDGTSDILCNFFDNSTYNGVTLLNGLSGESIWHHQMNLDLSIILQHWDIQGDGIQEILLKEVELHVNPDYYTFTLLSIPTNQTIWQKKYIKSKYSSDPLTITQFDHYIEFGEYNLESAGLELFYYRLNYSQIHENMETKSQGEVQCSLHYFTFCNPPYWTQTFQKTWKSSSTIYFFDLPDLNGDGVKDFILGDEKTGPVVRDGATGKIFSKFPGNPNSFYTIVFQPDQAPLVVFYVSENLFYPVFRIYSFQGLRIIDDDETNTLSISFLGSWLLIIFAISIGYYYSKRKKA